MCDAIGFKPPTPDSLCCYAAAVYGDRCDCWRPVIAPHPTQHIEHGPMPVQPTRCGDCAYRRDSPERQELDGDPMPYTPGRVFLCHTGMPKVTHWVHPSGFVIETDSDDYKPIMLDVRAWQADGRPAIVCAGWAQDDRRYQEAVNR